MDIEIKGTARALSHRKLNVETAVVSIRPALIARIKKLVELAKEQNLYSLTILDFSADFYGKPGDLSKNKPNDPNYDTDGSLKVEFPTLTIHDDSIKWQAFLKGTKIKVETQSFPLSVLDTPITVETQQSIAA